MPVLWPPSAPLIAGAAGEKLLRSYALYYDLFDEILAAGSVDGTDSTDTNALRDVVDTGSRLSLNDELILNGVEAFRDPGLRHTTLTPGPWVMWNAYAVLWQIANDDDVAGGYTIGLDTDLSGDVADKPLRWTGEEFYVDNEGPNLAVPADVPLSILMVRRPDSAGYFYLYRTGSDDWRLFWMDQGPLVTV